MKIKKTGNVGVSTAIGGIVNSLKKNEPKDGVNLLSIATKLSKKRQEKKR